MHGIQVYGVPDAESILGHEVGKGLHDGRRLGLLVVGEDS
jgi:hypothetical protein